MSIFKKGTKVKVKKNAWHLVYKTNRRTDEGIPEVDVSVELIKRTICGKVIEGNHRIDYRVPSGITKIKFASGKTVVFEDHTLKRNPDWVTEVNKK